MFHQFVSTLLLLAMSGPAMGQQPQGLRPPSPPLQAQIQQWIDEFEPSDELGAWPQRVMKERNIFLIHGNQAYLWYLTPAGIVFCLDPDTFARSMDVETDARSALNAVAQGARRRPELKEMLPPRPPEAVDCPHCRGTGDEDQFGKCACAGLGWLVK